ncbi:MAG: glycosyltransferase family 4 protein [Propionicimonas sp.]
MHIALCGPMSPSGVSALLTATDAARADQYLGIGGVPVYELAKGLVAAGHRVSVVTTAGLPEVSSARFEGRLIDVVCVPRRSAGPAIRDIYRLERGAMSSALRECRPDIVHAHWTYEFELAAQDSRLPHVTTAHDAPFTILRQMRDPYRAARLAVALRARPGIRRLSTVSPYMVSSWRRQMAYRGPIEIIPNSIPRTGVASSRTPGEHPVLLDVTDSGELKNVRGLLRAFRLLREVHPQAELRVAGHGLDADGPLARWAGEHKLSPGVSFVGVLPREQLAKEYSRAWVFVHASLEESFGLTVLEALASGVPVVGGRDSGGVPFVLDNGRAGWLTDVSDPQALASTMLRLIDDGPPSPPTGAAGYARARFSPSAVSKAHLEWYERSTGGGT